MTFLFLCLLIQISYTSLESTEYPCSSKSSCGCSLKPSVLTKIVGGEETDVDTWNWAVSIRSRNNHICGGSLISPDLVLTAAHCFGSISRISGYSVTAGSTHLSIIKQQRSIAQVFRHRNYLLETFVNDIAAIRLSSPFNMNDPSLALVCLPTSITKNNTNNTSVIAIGWGVFSEAKVTSDTLRQVTLETIPSDHRACQRTLNDDRVQMCAGVSSGGKDTCQGDSGGPLMMFVNHQWQLVGITSYGAGCGLPGYAGVYTRVLTYEEPLKYLLENNRSGIDNTFVILNSASLISTSFCWVIFLIFLIIYLVNK